LGRRVVPFYLKVTLVLIPLYRPLRRCIQGCKDDILALGGQLDAADESRAAGGAELEISDLTTQVKRLQDDLLRLQQLRITVRELQQELSTTPRA
jgi:hypothetical protein